MTDESRALDQPARSMADTLGTDDAPASALGWSNPPIANG